MPAPSNPRTLVSLIDVARHAGVSRATASLVLRDSPLVARKTRERVHRAVEELGYIYNRRAANLRGQRTKTIGLLVPNISNPFFAELTIGVDATLDIAGYIASWPTPANRSIAGKASSNACGSKMSTASCCVRWQAPRNRSCYSSASPGCPASNHCASSRNKGDYVGPDFELGLEQVSEYLIRLGHRRIALIGGDQAHSVTLARRAGFTKAMQRHHLRDDLILKVPPTRQAGFDAVDPQLDGPEPPTAAVCANDMVAFGFMVGLKSRGLRPGVDVAVTGVDDVPEATLSDPSLTTISTSARQLGEAAAQLLLRRIENPRGAAERILFPTRLIVRQSCGSMIGPDQAQKDPLLAAGV